jgi:hypothetical protein
MLWTPEVIGAVATALGGLMGGVAAFVTALKHREPANAPALPPLSCAAVQVNQFHNRLDRVDDALQRLELQSHVIRDGVVKLEAWVEAG